VIVVVVVVVVVAVVVVADIALYKHECEGLKVLSF
jgi:hypothetical protein